MKNKFFAASLAICILGLSSALAPLFAFAENSILKGDVNKDGAFNVSDVVLLQKWLLAVPDVTFIDWTAADFCEDGKLNIFDLCLMKRSLLEKGYDLEYQAVTDQIYKGYTDEIFKTASWNDEKIDASAVITSMTGLQDYLSVFFDWEIVKQYTEIYNDSYFDDHVLLLNSLYQPCGTEPLLTVSGVTYTEQTVHVTAKWRIPECAEDVMSALLVQISLPKNTYMNCSVVWDILEEPIQEPDEPSVIDPPEPDRNTKQINVINILQKPELPTGCESVSLTILLNYLGYSVNKLTLARNYMPKLNFYWSNGVYYGADFRTTFAGNPESSHSYGCYAPCIITTANNYFSDNGIHRTACNITGTDFDSLLTNYIDQDIPVLIWITSNNLHEPKLTSIWTTPVGEKVQWLAYEHCVVLTGYDKDNNLIYVSDPLVGNTSYDYSKIKQRYIDLGQQAVYIKP
ncbi:MAG: C39 family peptidase [Oscillospiraceae bacterium]|nr:C39 family peptidase [Oscillospiraceae bacterium]